MYTIYFCIFTLCSVISINLLISFDRLVDSLKYFTYIILFSVNKDNFILFFVTLSIFYYYSCLVSLAKTSSILLH